MTRMGATKKSVGHRLSRRVWIRVRRDVRSSFFSATVCRDDDGGLASVSRVSSAVGSLRAVYLRNGSEIVFHCNGGLLSRIYHFRLIWMIHGTVRRRRLSGRPIQFRNGSEPFRNCIGLPERRRLRTVPCIIQMSRKWYIRESKPPLQ